MFRHCALALVLAALAVSVRAADRDFTLDVEPLFLGTSQPMRIQPFAITVENRGSDTNGVVTVTAGDVSTRFPVDLPQGSRKRLTAYLEANYSLRGIATLSTPRGGTEFRFESNADSMTRCIVGVTDAPGELGFVRYANRNQYQSADLYLKPDAMPDRAAGYVGVGAIYLGEGSERMSNDAFLALKRYVVAGGAVVVSGGASMPLQGDPRWRPLLPVVNARPKTVHLNGSVYGLEAQGECTLGVGETVAGSSTLATVQGMPLIVKKSYGFGRVVFIALNLTEGPAKGWEGREKILRTAGVLEDNGTLGTILNLAAPDPYGYSGPYSGYSPAGVYPGPSYAGGAQGSDPFSAKVPETSTVIYILILYFILVVPVNLLVLRKLGKGELAWITAPILSLGFAFVFFRFSAGLYAADLSTASTGVILAKQGEPDGYYVGRTQMFFPRGGRFDLKLKGVEAILSMRQNMGAMGNSSLTGFDPVDTGELSVPGAAVTNLAFREFSLLQRVQAGGWFKVTVDRTGSSISQVSLTNSSPYVLKEVGVFLKDKAYGFGDLSPGQTLRVTQPGFSQQEELVDLAMRVASAGSQGVLTGIVEGFRPGPQIGSIASANNRNRLLMTFADGAR